MKAAAKQYALRRASLGIYSYVVMLGASKIGELDIGRSGRPDWSFGPGHIPSRSTQRRLLAFVRIGGAP